MGNTKGTRDTENISFSIELFYAIVIRTSVCAKKLHLNIEDISLTCYLTCVRSNLKYLINTRTRNSFECSIVLWNSKKTC